MTARGSEPSSGSGAAERREQLLHVRLGADRPLVERLEEVGRVLGRLLEQLALAHRRDSIGPS